MLGFVDLQHLIRSMVCPDPAYRITAMQAYHHPALQPAAPAVIITPHFVRAATAVDEEQPPIPYDEGKKPAGAAAGKQKTKKSKVRELASGARSATPTALGESIKQHTSAPPKKTKGKGKGKGKEQEQEQERDGPESSPTKKASKLVIKHTKELRYSGVGAGAKVDQDDPTRESCLLT